MNLLDRLLRRKPKPRDVTLEDLVFLQRQVRDPADRYALGFMIREELRRQKHER